MIGLKIIKSNQQVYNGQVLKAYVCADNLGTIELQKGHSNAMYKIRGAVRYVCKKNDEHSIDFCDAIACITPSTIEIIG